MHEWAPSLKRVADGGLEINIVRPSIHNSIDMCYFTQILRLLFGHSAGGQSVLLQGETVLLQGESAV